MRTKPPQAGPDVALRALQIAIAVLLVAACASTPKEARFYQEDGPPERVPADLLATADAIPHEEPLNPNANRPYVALGRTYVPDLSDAPFHQRGIASWYGRQFQGNRTASGERYDMFAMTAAHPTLPIPSYARVTNTHDARSVIVRINDRGPFLHDRVIDLSYVAAARLGLATAGSGEVEIERIFPGRIVHAAPTVAPAVATPPASAPGGAAAAKADEQVAIALPVAPLGSASVSAVASPGSAPGSVVAPPSPAAGSAVAPPGSAPASTVAPVNPPQVAESNARGAASGPPTAGPGPRWSVQLGAFKVAMNAEALRDRLALLLASPDASGLPAALRSPRIEREAGLSRVLIGDATDRAVAVQWSRLLERYLARPTALFAH